MTVQQTSIEAYKYAIKSLNKKQMAVLQALKDNGPSTDRELCEKYGFERNTVPARRGELVRLGLVCETGIRLDNVSKRKALVWQAIYPKELL
ncbi:MAG: hypothetical protein HC880_00420 [Bacteroidia bacterium]|nr:hypothetical protein [Bacteroidia bacterium]